VVPATSSAAMPVTLQVKAGTGTLQLSSISITPGTGTGATDFTFATGTTCPTDGGPVAAGASCVVNLIFTPATAGNKSATLSFTGSNLTGSPVSIQLTGIGASTAAGFQFTAMQPGSGGIGTNVSILPGDTVTFTLVIQPNPGFIGPIMLSCPSNAIPFTICTVSPSTINVTTSPSPPITITITLQTNCVVSLMGPRAPGGSQPQTPAAPFGAIGGLALLLAVSLRKVVPSRSGANGWAQRLAPACAMVVLLFLVMTGVACVSNLPPALPNSPTTPAGVYTLPITATAPPNVKQMVPLTVHVI